MTENPSKPPKRSSGTSGQHRLGESITGASSPIPPPRSREMLSQAAKAIDRLADAAERLIEEVDHDRQESKREGHRNRIAVLFTVSVIGIVAGVNLWIGVRTAKVQSDIERKIEAARVDLATTKAEETKVEIVADGQPRIRVVPPAPPEERARYAEAVERAAKSGEPAPPPPKAQTAVELSVEPDSAETVDAQP